MPTKHLDEARRDAIKALLSIVAGEASITRAVLVDDLFGRIRVVLWSSKERAEDHRRLISEKLHEVASPFWAGEIWNAVTASKADKLVYDRAWDEAHAVGDRVRLADRVRNRTAWFAPISEPPWSAVAQPHGPPIIVFYSFKGGVGRTTALASFAIQRARMGERVAVLDLDLDAPGAGTLLAADEHGTTAEWGVVDYLLERPLGEVDLRDYYHGCRRPAVTGSGEILVVPAGSLEPEREYLGKLARLDLEPAAPGGSPHPLRLLLDQVRTNLDPNWICIDARAGLSEPAGLLLSGPSHLHVLFGTSSEQSWRGLTVVLERIGASRVRENRPQLDCVLVHAMVPEDPSAAKTAMERFEARALAEFRGHYYAPDPDDPDEDRLWYVRDAEASDAPHAPITIPYQPKLAHYERVDDVADHLADARELGILGERIAARFGREES
jgi:hypothetical protein